MQKRKSAGIMIDRAYVKARYFRKIWKLRLAARKRLKALNGGYKGSQREYKEVVLKYWEQYHMKPKKYWYQMYCDGKTAFDPRYIPDTIWDQNIYPYFNNLIWGRAYADKCAYDILFPLLKRPKTIAKNSAGRFYGDNQDLITEDEAVRRCCEAGRFIIKFSTYSSGGRNIQVFERGEVNEEIVRKLFHDFKFNFIVQELVDQHEKLARIHAESLNTLRVISFFFKGEVHILSAQLRMGSGSARVDNYSSGGYACNINSDGCLSERAVSKKDGWAYEHPCGLKFKDIVVPSYDKVVEIIKREHSKLPQLNIIGWDFAIDRDGEPVFIEINMTPESNQNGSGPTFGNLTDEVLKDVFIDKTLQGAFD